jgi:hypothetical protein
MSSPSLDQTLRYRIFRLAERTPPFVETVFSLYSNRSSRPTIGVRPGLANGSTRNTTDRSPNVAR